MRNTVPSKIKFLKKFLVGGQHIHPLVIMLIDILIVFFSFSLAYVLIATIGFKKASLSEYFLLIAVYGLVSIPVIYAWRLHSGLLRFSNTMDLFRVFGAVISFTVILLILLFIF